MKGDNNAANKGPSQADIQRQSIQRDMDKADQNAGSGAGSNIIGQHNYSYDAQTPNQKGLAAIVHRKIRPLLKWWRRIHYRLEESARKRKRYVLLTFLGVALFSFAYGHFNKLGIAVANTKVGTVRNFVNNDAIQMTGEKYDTHNQSLEANFRTSSESGAIEPKNLQANFVFAQMPKQSGLKRPTMNLIPTFNNHFTVIIHHVYKGFGGVEISFHNNTPMSVGTLSHVVSDTSSSPYLNDADNKEIAKVTKSGTTAQGSEKVERLLRKLQKRDVSNFVLGEQLATKHYQSYIDPTASPRDLALNDLSRHLNNDRSKVKGDNTLIKQEKNQIKADQGKVREINRGADTGDKQKELTSTAEEVKDLDNDITNFEDKIEQVQQDIRLTQSRISRVKNNISVLPKTQAPRPIGAFNNSAH